MQKRAFPRSGDASVIRSPRRTRLQTEKEKKAWKTLRRIAEGDGSAEGDKITNAVNIRGSHWTLGEEVPRRFRAW